MEPTPKTERDYNLISPSPIKTPKANVEFSRELKQVLHERNLLTKRTKKRVFEALDDIVNEHVTQNVRRKKENTLFEIIISEKSYVNQLKTILNFFMKPAKEKKLLNNLDYEQLFGNVQTILNVNETLLRELYKGSNNVIKAFLTIAPYFKLYSSYAMEFKKTLGVLQKIKVKSPAFYNFMEMQETRPEVQNKLSSLLIAPIQRIPRYKLLLEQLLNITSPSDPDYENIQQSLNAVEEAAKHINKVIEDQENMQRLLEIQRCLRDQPSIITPGRILLKEGVLHEYNNLLGPSEKFYVILLNDIILFSKMKTSFVKPNSLKCKRIFPLHKCTLVENSEKGCFQINCQNDSIILYDKELSVTKEWVKCIQEAVSNSSRGRKTLRKESSERRPVKRKDLNEYHDVGLSPGVPLKRRRYTTEIDSKLQTLGVRRSIRSMTPSLPSKCTTISISSPPKPIINSNDIKPNTDLYVFGKDNINTGFTFKLTNILGNISSAVTNIFKFRR